MTETLAGRRRLGRGLEALLGPTREEAEREESLVELAIADIRPNPYQPRRDVDPAALEELQAFIRKAGLLQPGVVRPVPGGKGGFELIAGERRMRAWQALGWERIPAVTREVEARTAGSARGGRPKCVPSRTSSASATSPTCSSGCARKSTVRFTSTAAPTTRSPGSSR